MEKTKERVIRELVEARHNIVNAVDLVLPARRDQVFLGTWSINDLLAHLIGWDVTNAVSVKEISQGSKPGCFTQWNPDWSAYNSKLVKECKCQDSDQTLAGMQASHLNLVEFLKRIPAEDFERDFGARTSRGGIITIANYLQAEIDDEREHCHQIKNWVEETR